MHRHRRTYRELPGGNVFDLLHLRRYTFIDCALYLPKSWTTDPERCAQVGVSESVEFATKPTLATTMIGRALDAGVPAPWVTGDEVYGADPNLRAVLEARGAGYVLAIACDRHVDTSTGRVRADQLAAALPAKVWQRLSPGDGAKGPRIYEWAWVQITADTDTPPGHRWLLVRRNRTTRELAYYRCYAPAPVPLSTLVRVAGRRWGVEEDFQSGNGLAGLDQHQVRRWTSWHRWTVLSMLALALLTVLAATEMPTLRSSVRSATLSCSFFRLFGPTSPSNPPHRSQRNVIAVWLGAAAARWNRNHRSMASDIKQGVLSTDGRSSAAQPESPLPPIDRSSVMRGRVRG